MSALPNSPAAYPRMFTYGHVSASTMSDLSALIEHLCVKRADLVQQMAASPGHVSDEHIRDLAWLQSAFLAVEAEMRRAEREVLHEEVQERTSSIPYQNA